MAVDNSLFDVGGTPSAIMTNVTLSQSRVHQTAAYEPVKNRYYATQVIDDGVTLPGESGPPPDGTRSARGDLAINELDASGTVLNVMYVRGFDHGQSLGVEDVGGTTRLWISYKAVMTSLGGNTFGRSIAYLPFQAGAVIDVTDPSISDFTPFTANSMSPGFDPANNQFGINYNTGSGSRVRIYDLAAWRAQDFSTWLYDFPRATFPTFQGWALYGNYVYLRNGDAYSDDNPPPPDGNGNTYWTVQDVRTGSTVRRFQDLTFLNLPYREPEAVGVFLYPAGPQLIYGFAISGPRMNLYGISARSIPAEVGIAAAQIGEPDPGIQLTVTVRPDTDVVSWSVVRIVGGITQPLFAGTGPTLADQSVWVDTGPPVCVPVVYQVTVNRSGGGPAEIAQSQPITYVPPEGCAQNSVVGQESNVLGCADHYSAMIHWRGGAQPYPASAMTRLTQVTWSRTLNDTSEATITVLKGNISPDCCEAIGRAEPWVHELTLYRDGALVWQGPIVQITARRESITIQAKDVFAWMDKLVNAFPVRYVNATADAEGKRRGTIVYIAYNHIRLNLTDPRFSRPSDYPGILPYLVRRENGLPVIKVEKDGSSNVTIWVEYMGTILREWAKRGLTWTTVGRTLLLRARPSDATRAMARLTLEDFSGDVEVIRDGTSAATMGWATNQNDQDISEGTFVVVGRRGTAYGRLDNLVHIQEETISSADLQDAAGNAVAGRYPAPVVINVPDGSSLVPTAPIRIEQLVPGERIDVFADTFCIPLVQGFALSDVEVTWENGGEKVGISLIPLTSLDEELGS